MIFFTFLPEVVAFLQFILISVQETPFGPILVAAQFALFGLLVLTRPAQLLQTLTRWWPLLIVQILAVISTAWSTTPDDTLRYALQYLYTAVTGIFLARFLGARRFLVVLVAATFVFSIMCIIDGRQGTSFTHYVLIGLTGSKNQLAYQAQMLLPAAIAVLMLRGVSVPMRWIAILSVPLALYLLIETESSTAIILAVAATMALAVFWFAQRMTPSGRLGALLLGLAVLAPLLALLPEISGAVNHFVFDTLNKDPTLTGRTLLWERADALISRKPLLGYGYQSIWLGDSDETIALRRLTNIEDGRVFHFHHQFRQIAVDTGFVGVAAFIATLLAVLFAHFRRFLLNPSAPTSFFFIIFIMLVARCFVDVVLGPFSIHTLVFFAAAVFAFLPATEAHAVQEPQPRVRRPQMRLRPGMRRA